ncbi:LamG-like jellyroll fold domain-containing protein [Planctomycetota bacterium]
MCKLIYLDSIFFTRLWKMLAILSFALCFNGFAFAQSGVNLVNNSDFEDGVTDPWVMYFKNNAGGVAEMLIDEDEFITGQASLNIEISAGGNHKRAIHLYQEMVTAPLENGKVYTYAAWIKAAEERIMSMHVLKAGGGAIATPNTHDITIGPEWAEYWFTMTATASDPIRIEFELGLSDADVWIDHVRFYEGDYVEETVGGPRVTASRPNPENESQDIPRDGVHLSWIPGAFVQTHDVYFGEDVNDVNDATIGNPLGAQVTLGLDVNSLPLDRLDFDTTYYWRVDEVNAPSNPGMYKGNVWSFVVEPEGLPITDVNATASSMLAEQFSPLRMVDGSGLDAEAKHSATSTDMWTSTFGDLAPHITFEFADAYKLHELHIWNANGYGEPDLGYGVKDVNIATSTDGINWEFLGAFEVQQGPGQPGYTANPPLSLSGVLAKFVRLDIQSNWSGVLPQYSLSEVRFKALPVQAREPMPAHETANLSPQVKLGWRAGREAGKHEILMGTDPNVLEVLDVVAGAPSYAVVVDLDQTYYWQVNEVNDAETPSVWEGNLWSFSTVPYITIDDFEGYNDKWGTIIFQSWIDGLGWEDPDGNSQEGNGSGSTVGYWPEPTIETILAYDGTQSMPFSYDNTGGGNAVSEATLTLDAVQDWIAGGVKGFSMMVRGSAGNTGQLYCKINNTKLTYDGDAGDLGVDAWFAWNIDLSSVSGNLAKVSDITVGVQGGGAGTLYFDSMRLYPLVGEMIAPVKPDTDALVAHYAFEGDAADSTGIHNGELVNEPAFVAGKTGQALNITLDQYATVAFAETLGMNTFTVSAWVNISDIDGLRGILGTRFGGNQTFDLKVRANDIHGDVGSGTGWLNTALDIPGTLRVDTWHHIAYVIDDATDTAMLYLNGGLAKTLGFNGTPLFMKEGQELRIGVSSGTEFMLGSIDEVSLYNKALSAAEVAGLADRSGTLHKPF